MLYLTYSPYMLKMPTGTPEGDTTPAPWSHNFPVFVQAWVTRRGTSGSASVTI